MVSLDAPCGDEENGHFGDFFSAPEPPQPDELVDQKLVVERVRRLLDVADFSRQERSVIERRFGIEGTESMTLREVGELEGVTRERIRQVQNASLDYLRGIAQRRRLVG